MIFGPQKGADHSIVQKMDRWMSHYAETVKAYIPDADPECPGAGAAGGLGFAFRSFLNSDLLRGIDLVMDYCNLEERIRACDLVITGEGRLDGQTEAGKVPWGVAKLAKKYGKPVIAFCGSLGENASLCNQYGIDACFSILREPCTLEVAMKNTASNLSHLSEQVFRLLSL